MHFVRQPPGFECNTDSRSITAASAELFCLLAEVYDSPITGSRVWIEHKQAGQVEE